MQMQMQMQMQIGPKMATLQEKKTKMDPKQRFFSKIPQDF